MNPVPQSPGPQVSGNIPTDSPGFFQRISSAILGDSPAATSEMVPDISLAPMIPSSVNVAIPPPPSSASAPAPSAPVHVPVNVPTYTASSAVAPAPPAVVPAPVPSPPVNSSNSYSGTSSSAVAAPSVSSSSSSAVFVPPPIKATGLPILTNCPPPSGTQGCPVIMPDTVVPREGIFVPGLGIAGEFDHQNARCFHDPVYGMAEQGGFLSGMGFGAPTFPAAEGFGYATGAGSGYGFSGPVGNVGFGPYSIYGGYYNGYVPNTPAPPPMPSCPMTLPPPMPGQSGMFVQHPVYATRYGHAPFNYYHFDQETQQYVGAYVTELHIGKGF